MNVKQYIILVSLIVTACQSNDTSYLRTYDSPVFPDYRNVTVPCNIAPMNFSYIEDNCRKVETVFEYGDGEIIKFKGKYVRWNERRWRKMTASAKGGEINVSNSNGESWKIFVSNDEIDYGLQYRLVTPGYQVFGSMSIRERNLSNFKEKVIISGDELEGCVNCHEYNRADPEKFTMHFRGKYAATLLNNGIGCKAFETKTDSTLGKCVYPYWHPSGKYIAYSTNQTHQQFHIEKQKLIEVYDYESDILIYDLDGNVLKSPKLLARKGYLDNYPVFSADGRTLYFCRYDMSDGDTDLKKRKYSLCKIGFNPETGNVEGDVHTIIDAENAGYSVAFPRPSYDGRFIMYSTLDYGLFPAWHKESDLWLYDIESGTTGALEQTNSPDAESFHNFSSNSRWFVFGSRRDDGRFTHAYIAHINADGETTKPFLLPQKEPVRYYSRQFYSYNTPCFVNGPVKFDRIRNRKLVLSNQREYFQYGQ